MDWKEVFTALGIVGGGGSLAALAWWVKMGRTIEGRNAERSSNDWFQKVIARQDREAERQRDEMQSLRERNESLQRELLDLKNSFHRETRVFRSVSAATARDIRKINDGRIPEERLETIIGITGMNPLDP
ncbi:MAG: hypothetical protein H0V63_08410 [Burkholderiaceae bacterium]|nr:hypothetical protein [Burkholderiaceae bacterium]